MKIRQIKFAVILTAVLFILTTGAWAQLLKPGEIVYSRAATVPGGNCDTAAIWVIGLDGSNDRRITQGLHPRISPDGRKILFKRFDPSILCSPFFNGSPQWWIRDLTTGIETLISGNFRTSFGHYFSSDSNRADRQITTDETGQICQMKIDGSNRVCYGGQINPVQGFGHFGVRGSDSLIVFQNYDTSRPADGGLYTLSYDRTNLQKIPNTSLSDVNSSWSNDGQTIAYATFPGNRTAPYFFTNLFSILPDGSNKTQLTFLNNLPATEGFSYSLVWTLDNATILNAAKLNGVAGIYKIAADGSGTILGTIPITPGAAPEWVGGIVPAYGEKQIASWGGGVSGNNNYSLVSTIGQAFAGQTSAGGAFNLQSGFWTYNNTRTPFDFDGDGKSDQAVFRPSNANWYVNRSSNGFSSTAWGNASDKLVPEDYDGDGKTDLAVFRDNGLGDPNRSYFFILKSGDNTLQQEQFGRAGDDPSVVGDWDGDGRADVAVYREGTSGGQNIFYYRPSLEPSADFITVPWGINGDKAVRGDFDGDTKFDAAVFRPSNQVWYVRRSSDNVLQAFNWGIASDKLVPADYDDDGKTDAAVYRGGTWYILRSSTLSLQVSDWGTASDAPVPADYDGDGKADLAVFHPSNEFWYFLNSTTGFSAVQWGVSTDIPIPSVFVP